MKEKLKGMPIPVVATMLGAATLSNVYQSLGYDWIRHVIMWAATVGIDSPPFDCSPIDGYACFSGE